MHLSKTCLERCESLGFTPPYIVDLATFDDTAGQGLNQYISADYHGSMSWMAETQLRRSHPNKLWPAAKSGIVLGMNYGPDMDPLISLCHPTKATISVYARNRDYHDLIKGRLKDIAGLIARDTGQDVKVFVDTAPLMEKPLAAIGGLGWQGKHTNLVSRDYGSWLFLGVILSAAMLTPTSGETDHCGTCRKCLDICPTEAFPAPYQLDARRCISYLTIEHEGPVEESLREKMGNRIYGCDDCLAVCPWNKFAKESAEIKLKAKDELNAPDLVELAVLSEVEFRQKFSGSPIKRIGRNRFMRNVIYAIGNSQVVSLKSSLEPHLFSDNPVIRDAARWASKALSS